ncbi:MAG: beta galactosidase jelly roll domain-containing protein [Verrucomicrobia bacterium]|nr:beta galactosidase jelly roll domain-containing protein [Verrucomicrobiota bacterium]
MNSMNNKQSLAAVAAMMVVLMVGAPNTPAAVPRPEHPRPDLMREDWLTLNGEWQFEIDKAADGEARGLTYGKDLNAKIIVPFCPESKLSGLAIPTKEHMKDVWYRRTFELTPAMQGKRVRIHFGGVDYRAWVYLNGQFAGSHVGENVDFKFEITKFLRAGSNEVVVKVLDDLSSGLQPGGKQSESDQSAGCFYTRTTGIWQPVWLEAVGSSFLESISVVPDPDNSRVIIDAKINGADPDLSLKAEAFADGKLVGSDTASGPWQNRLVIPLSEKKLWEPGAPFLYDLKFTLCSGKATVDELKSYFGLRKIAIDGRRFLINGKPVFQRLILDQGFYPEGLWTAPSDEALKNDIVMSMACGYNGARLHQKVFEPRFLYWADKLGYLVWGEYPNAGYGNQPQGFSAVVNEWTEILLRDRCHPSIVGWCAFNENFEGSGELQQMIWHITKAIDPTRPALEASGWTHTLPNPEVRDAHDYTDRPASLHKRWMDYFAAPPEGPFPPARYYNPSSSNSDRGVPFMISEIGGIGWGVPEGGWSYGQGPKTPDEFYARYQGTIDAMLDNPNLFGFCYTQLTDIEQERNGLYYYDRKPKFDAAKLCQITSRAAAYERGEPMAPRSAVKMLDVKWKVLVGAMQDGKLSTPYQYVTDKPADDWFKEGFDDRAWKTGLAPFGNGNQTRTEWKTREIHFRKSFAYDGGPLKNGAVVIRHNDSTEIYLNGRKILGVTGSRGYYLCLVTEELQEALKKGTNTIAVHSHEGGQGQWIDLAILVD